MRDSPGVRKLAGMLPPRFLPSIPLLALLTLGCQRTPADLYVAPAPSPIPAPPSAYDPARTGTIVGRVVWEGPPPAVPDFLAIRANPGGAPTSWMQANPLAPRIGKDGGLGDVAVVLDKYDPAAAKPWDLPSAKIEMADHTIEVIQGPRKGRVGFAKRGTAVEIASGSASYRMLRARGAAFFTLAFPPGASSLTRSFDSPGFVELSSGSGQFWAAAELAVLDHPYAAVTRPDGRFEIANVPAGPCEVQVRVPDWRVASQERDPESGLAIRQRYRPPATFWVLLAVEVGKTANADVTVPATAFP